MSFRVPRGTQDLLPGEVEIWQFVEEKARDWCRRYHIAEVRTPIFEQTDLFQRGVGETTDIVSKEMYTFTDRGGRSLTLRPEGTAPVVRAFVEHKAYGWPQPVKWFYIGPMFRYERPQAGRMRQFHQFGVEMFGVTDPGADAELIALGADFYDSLGLTGVQIELNSVGCPDCRPAYLEQLVAYFTPQQEALCKDCQSRLTRNPLRILDCKNKGCQELIAEAPQTVDHLCETCDAHFDAVKKQLDRLGVTYTLNWRLVRGLDYYTQTAFEYVLDGRGGQAGSIGGGGRYNGLVAEMGGGDVPGVGFATGLERTVLALKEQEVLLPIDRQLDCFLVTLGGQAKREAVSLLRSLRQAGLSADRDLLDRKMKGQMKAADRSQARFVAILGEEELAQKRIVVKEMASGHQEEVDLEHFISYIRQGLKR